MLQILQVVTLTTCNKRNENVMDEASSQVGYLL